MLSSAFLITQRKNSEVRVDNVRADWKKSTLALFVVTVVLVVVLLIISSFSDLTQSVLCVFYCVRCYPQLLNRLGTVNLCRLVAL